MKKIVCMLLALLLTVNIGFSLSLPSSAETFEAVV